MRKTDVEFTVLPVIDLDDNDNILVPLPPADKIAEGQRFCDEDGCFCKYEPDLIQSVYNQVQAGLITEAEAVRIYMGEVI